MPAIPPLIIFGTSLKTYEEQLQYFKHHDQDNMKEAATFGSIPLRKKRRKKERSANYLQENEHHILLVNLNLKTKTIKRSVGLSCHAKMHDLNDLGDRK